MRISVLSARLCWIVLALCVLAYSLPAQVVTSANAAGFESNQLQAQETKFSPPVLNVEDSTTDTTTAKPSNQDAVPTRKHMHGIIPDYEDTDDTDAKRFPLTTHQKYVLAFHETFDLSAHVGNLLEAAFEQATNSQPHYGQGWGAYGERFGASEADQVTQSFLVYGVLPSLLHDDPRYFRRGRGSRMSRVWYAANRTFVTSTDRGRSTFNAPETLGQLISCGISTSYYPQQDRTASRVFSNWAVAIAANSGYNVLLEYYPDFMRGLFHNHKKQDAPPPSGN